MAELIDNDILIGTLRFIDAKHRGDAKGLTVVTRHSTNKVVMGILTENKLIDKSGNISAKGKLFLEKSKLRSMFEVKYTPYGVVYKGDKNGYVRKVREILKLRPEPNYTLDHQPLWPELTAMRAHYISSEEHLYDKKVAMVGDYDSTALALNLISTTENTTVFDIDERLLDFHTNIAEKYKFPLKTVHLDLFKPVPPSYIGTYDVFVTDPPYAMGGMKKFIDFGITLLRNGGVGYIAVPYHEKIGWTERMLYEVNNLIVSRGCVITDTLKNFHHYQTADGLRSSMIRIKKGSVTKNIQMEKMYSYKESNVNKPIILVNTL